MTLEKLLKLCVEAASTTAEFNQWYDFAGEVGPEPVLKLLIQNDEMITFCRLVRDAPGLRPDSQLRLGAIAIIERHEAAWAKPPIDPPVFPR